MSNNQMIINGVAHIPEEHRKKIELRKWFSKIGSFYKQQFGYDWRLKHKDLLEKYDWMIQDDPG